MPCAGDVIAFLCGHVITSSLFIKLTHSYNVMKQCSSRTTMVFVCCTSPSLRYSHPSRLLLVCVATVLQWRAMVASVQGRPSLSNCSVHKTANIFADILAYTESILRPIYVYIYDYPISIKVLVSTVG